MRCFLIFVPCDNFKELLTKSVGPVPFSAEYLGMYGRTDGRTDRRINTLAARGLEEHIMQVSLISVIIVSFMLFIVLLSLM